MRSLPIYDALNIFQCFQYVAHFYIVMDAYKRMLIGLYYCASIVLEPFTKVKLYAMAENPALISL